MDILLSEACIDVRVDLRDATRGMDGDDRGLGITEFSERSHDDDSLELSQANPLKMGET